jgi:HSP20 family protein
VGVAYSETKKSGGTMSLITSTNRLFPTFFDEFFSDRWPVFAREKMAIPAVNIKEYEGGYHVEVAAPGLRKEDFQLSMEGNWLTISAEKKEEKKEEKAKYTRQEFSYSSFKRTFELPENVLTDKIDATYKDGVLIIDLPVQASKKAEKPEKMIAIH